MDTLKPFSEKARNLKLGMYEHYSGKRYTVISVARHSESLEEHVVYQAHYGDRDVWVRPFSMFCEQVEINKLMVPRFRHIEDV